MTDESYWPIRNVAEYAYCPRLFYLMQIEGIFIPSDDTEKGQAVHERVNRPSGTTRRKPTEGDPRPEKVRSLTLSSDSLNLTGTLDLVELSGQQAVPIEYRKGRPHHTYDDHAPIDPWPFDRVQIGLQSLLLIDSGYEVQRAVLYYASERRRIDVAIDPALLAEARTVLKQVIECSKGSRPRPLLNDPRCARCSLQPVCLPDEINQLAANAGVDVSTRRLWPPRDDGIHVVAQHSGTKIGVSGDCLRVTDREGSRLKEIPLASVESLSLLGSVQISTQAVQTLAGHGIPIAFLTAAGRLTAMIDPLDSVSALVRKSQVERFSEASNRLELAKALVKAKISNQRTLLMRNNPSLLDSVASSLRRCIQSVETAKSIDEVRGHEGRAASLYFEHFSGMFKEPVASEFSANGRMRRPAPDPINSCLSFGYTMLTHECTAALRTARLEPSIGAYHVSKPGRPAFSLDLMEPFRPLIADSIAVLAFNRGELGDGHFIRTSAGCILTDAGRKSFFELYGRRMDTEVTHPFYRYTLSYRRMIMLHARLIAAWLVGDVDKLTFLTTR